MAITWKKIAYADQLHTQGTDQGLDTGGANAVIAAQVKTAVDQSHASGSDNQDLSGLLTQPQSLARSLFR